MKARNVFNLNQKKIGYAMAGFSLIEVLVALFILAAGVLGITGMQAISLQNSRQSIGRTQASNLSQELLDRVRANKAYLYSSAINSMPEITNCFTQNCTTAQLANFDVGEWKCNFTTYQQHETCKTTFTDSRSISIQEKQLLNSDGSITCSLVNNQRQCTVSVRWQEANAVNKTTEDFDFTVSLEL